MRKKTEVEMERAALAARVRAEATIVRLRILNEVLPAALEEFDRRVTNGESTALVVPSTNDYLDEALRQIGSGS